MEQVKRAIRELASINTLDQLNERAQKSIDVTDAQFARMEYFLRLRTQYFRAFQNLTRAVERIENEFGNHSTEF